MALSDELEALAKRHGALSYRNRADTQNPAFGFSEAGLASLLAEVRKQDDALILQLVEALESSNVEWKQLADSSDAGLWRAEDQDYYQQSEKAITAGRAWLEGKK